MRSVNAHAPFPLIDIRSFDEPRARGESYGSQAKLQISRSLSTYARLFASCGIDWASAARRALGYRECIDWVDPDLIQELDGIARGAGVQLADILALNCRTEILPASLFNNAGQTGAADLGECTAIAVSSQASHDGHCWLGQNWDWLGPQREALVILQTRDSRGMAIATLTEAGMLAKIGLNSHGMAVGLNILRSLDDGSRPGVPVHVLLRHALSQDSVDALRNRIAAISCGPGFGAGSNIPVADAAGQVTCFELSPRGWAEHRANDGVVVHTNHYLCSSLMNRQADSAPTLSTEARLRCAENHTAQRPVSVASIEALLRDESDGFISVCRRPDPTIPLEARLESVAGVRMDCTARRWWIAPDIPTLADFEEVPTGFAPGLIA